MFSGIRRCSGAALPVVVFFAAFALITASVYIQHQRILTLPALKEPASFQALLNARSGVWKGMELLAGAQLDTIETLDTRDRRFGGDLFVDSTVDTLLSTKLSAGGGPVPLSIYSCDSFGGCEVGLEYAGATQILKSVGNYRETMRHVTARIGGKVFGGPDTVLYLQSASKPTGGRIEGEFRSTAAHPGAPEKGSPRQRGLRLVREKELRELLSDYDRALGQAAESTVAGTRLLIRDSEELSTIPDIVTGDLFLHSSFEGLSWESGRTVVVLGDLQCTGNAPLFIRGLRLIVNGSAQFFDKTVLRDVSVFTRSKFVLGGEVQFGGDALSLSDVLVYEKAFVRDRGTITVVKRESRSKRGTDTARTSYQIDIADRARVDGSLIALGGAQGIRIGPNVAVRGLMWADGAVCHQGVLQGALWAKMLVDCRTGAVGSPKAGVKQVTTVVTENTLVGTIRKLGSFDDYRLPFFLGQPCIVGWVEQ